MKLFRNASQSLRRMFGQSRSNSDVNTEDRDAPISDELKLGDSIVDENDIVVSSYSEFDGEQLMRSLSILAAEQISDANEKQEQSLAFNQSDNMRTVIDLSVQFEQPAKLIATSEVFDPRMHTCVFVFRDAAETLCREYHGLQNYSSESIDEYCLRNLDGWYAHTESYLNGQTMHDCDLFPVAFESLVQNQPNTLYEVCGFIELDASFQQCHIVANATVAVSGTNNGPTASQLLEPETYNAIQNRAQLLYRRAMMIDSADQDAA